MNNNMNDAPGGRAAGAGDGNLWYYVALVPMLALAVCRSVWKKESQKEIQKVKVQDPRPQRVTTTLKDLEFQLMERQNAYCSYIRHKSQRLEMEKNMLRKVVEDPIEADLDLESDLKDIFKRDNHCAALSNMDKRKNGKLMWDYLKYWQLQVTVQKEKRAEEAKLGEKIETHTK